MAYSFTESPSQSPNQGLFHSAHYSDNTCEGSSPDSPHQSHSIMFNSTSVQYELHNYGTTPSMFYPAIATKVPLEFNNSVGHNQADPRRSRSMSMVLSGKEKETIPNMHLRRRAQNRASQRAFRERKEKHVKGLEHQLEDLHEKHRDLLQSYNRQIHEVGKLNGRIADLTTELNTLRTLRQPRLQEQNSEVLLPDKFDKFDAFPSHDILYSGPDCYFDKSAVDLNSEFSQNTFEDSL